MLVEPTIKEETLDEIPEGLVASMIEHTPVESSQAYTDITMEANVTDDLSVPYASFTIKEDLILTADAKDDQMIKTIALFYKNNEQSQFKKVLLQQDYNNLLYHFTVYSPNLIAKESMEYYYEASDGKNKTKTETYKVTITGDKNSDPLRFNVKNEEFLSGENIVKVTSTAVSPGKVQLFIDEKEMTEDTFRSLESESYLAFEVSGVNTFFQNGVTMGDEVLRIFDDWIPQWKTIMVPI